MKRNWKALLRQGFEAPPAAGKKDFLDRCMKGTDAGGAAGQRMVRHGALVCGVDESRGVDAPRSVGSLSFVCSQAAYIGKRVWAVSAVMFLAAFAGAVIMKKDILWSLSAVMPLPALVFLTESGRSERWGMAELEQASRFSLKSVTLARMGIVGMENLILFCLLIPLAFANGRYGLIQTGVCLTLPYLLTSYLGAWALRRHRGREGDLVCVGIAFFVGGGGSLLRQAHPLFYENLFLKWGIASGVILAVGVANQYRQILKSFPSGAV